MQLSFSHIMKHWKRNPAAQPTAVAGKVPGSRNVLLRFYPPQSALGWFRSIVCILFFTLVNDVDLLITAFLKKLIQGKRKYMNSRKTKRIHYDVLLNCMNFICQSGTYMHIL